MIDPSYQDHLLHVQKRKEALRDLIRSDLAESMAKRSFLVLEIGCGHGHFLSAYARARPEHSCLGLDILASRLKKAQKRCEGLENTVFVKAEAEEFLEVLDPSLKIGALYILFPDPWPKRKHADNRLIQKDFLELLKQRLSLGAKVYFRTDHKPYFEWAFRLFATDGDWEVNLGETWPIDVPTYFQTLTGGRYESFVATLTRTH